MVPVGVQADSVKNQYEHFLSLLQAHCSMVAAPVHVMALLRRAARLVCEVADRYVQDEEEVLRWNCKVSGCGFGFKQFSGWWFGTFFNFP